MVNPGNQEDARSTPSHSPNQVGSHVPTPRFMALIPARGSSKGIPRKNIAPLAGKPLIAWSIAAAQQSQHLSRTIVSTEDTEIATIAQRWGAEVPFLRPPELSQDSTPGIEPLIHAVRWLEEHESYCPDYVLLLQPTSPLRRPEDIDAAITMARDQQADAVVSVCQPHTHPYWMKRIDEQGVLRSFLPLEHTYSHRQDLPSAYALNGAIYLVRREVLLQKATFYPDNTLAYVMPMDYSLDVDTAWDLYLVDLILKNRVS